MTRWEYCDVTWQPSQVVVTLCAAGGTPQVPGNTLAPSAHHHL
jgi:hypothetical protein